MLAVELGTLRLHHSVMEGAAIEYRVARGGLQFQHSPLGGTMADCGGSGAPGNPQQTEFSGHHNGHHPVEPDDIKYDIKSCYSNTSTPPTPLDEGQAPESKGRGRKRGGINKGRDGLGWHAIDHGNPEQIFGSKADLQMHTQLHMREAKPYKCSQCSKTFANSSYLSQHTRIHLGIKPYRCEICQRKFTQLSHLQQHIRTHTGDKPYKCRHPGCNKAFSQLSNLQSHSRCHQTDKPYKCNSCYKCFVDEPSLLEHIPKHKESKHLKTHICQYCGKSYTQETYLSKHMQKHAERTDKRPPILGLGRNALHQLGAHANNNNVPDQSAGPPPHPQQHAYWPKVSPDTANSIVDAITQHEACLQQQQQQQQQQQSNGVLGEHHMAHHRALMEHHRQMNGGGEPRPTGDSEQQHQQPTAPPTPTPQQSNGYDALGIKAPPSSTSAFTPIQAMGGLTSHHHLGHLNPHQLGMSPASRPAYIPYDSLSFSGHKMAAAASAAAGQLASPAPSAASFPNQLISLHQIRNYAHQPMVGEHLLAGLNKDKSQ